MFRKGNKKYVQWIKAWKQPEVFLTVTCLDWIFFLRLADYLLCFYYLLPKSKPKVESVGIEPGVIGKVQSRRAADTMQGNVGSIWGNELVRLCAVLMSGCAPVQQVASSFGIISGCAEAKGQWSQRQPFHTIVFSLKTKRNTF